MSKGGKKIKAGPLINQQFALNQMGANLQSANNRVSQSNSMGSLDYVQDGTETIAGPNGTSVVVPKYKQKVTLSAPMQQMFDTTSGLANQKFQQFGAQGAFNGNQALEDKISALSRTRLDPYWDQQQKAFEADMLSKGIAPGSEAYNDSYSNFAQGRNDAYNSMWLGAHNDAFNQAMQEYNMPLEQAQALQQSAQGIQPQFNAVPQTNIPGIDLIGASMQATNANNAQHNASLGGIASLGGAILGGLF